eukprot:XP_001704862.1 Hypothetical protein GL50803_26638 [Giardia lamblia ATCC 50803]
MLAIKQHNAGSNEVHHSVLWVCGPDHLYSMPPALVSTAALA